MAVLTRDGINEEAVTTRSPAMEIAVAAAAAAVKVGVLLPHGAIGWNKGEKGIPQQI